MEEIEIGGVAYNIAEKLCSTCLGDGCDSCENTGKVLEVSE